MSDLKLLRENAARARRLAAGVTDPHTIHALRTFAEECEEKARQLDARALAPVLEDESVASDAD